MGGVGDGVLLLDERGVEVSVDYRRIGEGFWWRLNPGQEVQLTCLVYGEDPD